MNQSLNFSFSIPDLQQIKSLTNSRLLFALQIHPTTDDSSVIRMLIPQSQNIKVSARRKVTTIHILSKPLIGVFLCFKNLPSVAIENLQRLTAIGRCQKG